MSTNVPMDLKLYILSRRETTVLEIEHLIFEYLKLWNKGNPENELPHTPGLLQVYIWEYSSGNSCRCLDKCHLGWVFALLIMICNLDGKYLWSQGPVCKIVPGEDKWHFLWTWAHCIFWSSRPYRMFLVQEDKKKYLKCTWQGELGKVPMQWVACEDQVRLGGASGPSASLRQCFCRARLSQRHFLPSAWESDQNDLFGFIQHTRLVWFIPRWNFSLLFWKETEACLESWT